ncbi:MAG: tRNA lysidine(34) synthetase TilS [Myxococcales bacterium]|nr:tRNA lysidine(34) synthetase TilS [Myxococcales bacterium]
MAKDATTVPTTTRAVRTFREQLARAFARLGIGPGAPLLVACSGGADSLALADATLALRSRLALGQVTICHVHHGLRAGADADAEQVLAFARAGGANAIVERVVVDLRRGRGPEEAARDARHAALERAARGVGASHVLLAHTATDQVETVLMRLVAGTGARGLAGIPERRGRLVRPLLERTRAEVLAYIAARGLAPAHDESNDDLRFTRNRFRAEVVPLLRRENPALEEAVSRASRALAETEGAMAWAIAEARARLAPQGGRDEFTVAVPLLAALPPLLAKRLLADLALELGVVLGARHLDAVLALTRRKTAGSVSIRVPRLEVARQYDELLLRRADGAQPVAAAVAVSIEGEGGPFTTRSVRAGDRMRPATLRGRSRKLSDLLVDRKVPRAHRAESVVVLDAAGDIVWAEHVGVAVDKRLSVALTRQEPAAIK